MKSEEKKRVREAARVSWEKAKMRGLTMVNMRVPLDWLAKADRIAEARRQSRTAVIYDAVEKAWLQFLHEEAERKKLESERAGYVEEKPWTREQLRFGFKD